MAQQRSILFLDGENLVFRYQDMLAAGWTPHDDVSHTMDVFAWTGRVTREFPLLNVVRAYYYTSVVGSDDRVTEIRRAISANTFRSDFSEGPLIGQLVPIVYKKEARSQKTRNVDIQIVIDVMRFALTDEIDRVYLASGDGDYQPLIAEVMRRGKQVEVLAFSSGLNQSLTSAVDRFHSLDDAFVSARP